MKKKTIGQILKEEALAAELAPPKRPRGRPRKVVSETPAATLPLDELDDDTYLDTIYYVFEKKKHKKNWELITYTSYKKGINKLLEQLKIGAHGSVFEVVSKPDPYPIRIKRRRNDNQQVEFNNNKTKV